MFSHIISAWKGKVEPMVSFQRHFDHKTVIEDHLDCSILYDESDCEELMADLETLTIKIEQLAQIPKFSNKVECYI